MYWLVCWYVLKLCKILALKDQDWTPSLLGLSFVILLFLRVLLLAKGGLLLSQCQCGLVILNVAFETGSGFRKMSCLSIAMFYSTEWFSCLYFHLILNYWLHSVFVCFTYFYTCSWPPCRNIQVNLGYFSFVEEVALWGISLELRCWHCLIQRLVSNESYFFYCDINLYTFTCWTFTKL